MNTKSEIYPLDRESILRVGIENWQRSFFLPSSYREEVEPFNEILGIFKNIFDSADQAVKDLIIINCSLIFEYSNVINAAQALEKLGKLNIKRLHLDNRRFYEIFSPGYHYDYESLIQNLSPSDKLRAKFRALEGEFCNLRYKTFFSKNCFINIDKLCFLREEFIKRNNIKISTVHNYALPHTLINYNPVMGEHGIKMLQEVSISVADSMIKVLEKHSNGLFGKSHHQFFYHRTYNVLLETFKFYAGDLNIRKEIKGILFRSLGNIYTRILAVMANRKGIETIGAIHGNALGFEQDYSYYFTDFLPVKKYLVPTQNVKHNLEQIKEKYCYFGKSNCEIVSTDTQFYYKKWKIMNKAKSIPTSRKVIMYIEIPATYERYYYFPAINFFAQYDLSLKIFKLLKSQNKYKVILKAHPDKYKKGVTEKLYENFVDEIIVERFEKVWHMADIFIFGIFATTTFGHALLTDRNIICFDMLDNLCLSKAKEILDKRVHFVKTRFDDRNRIVFDEKEFLGVLAQKSKQPNTEFIETYMFPCGNRKV